MAGAITSKQSIPRLTMVVSPSATARTATDALIAMPMADIQAIAPALLIQSNMQQVIGAMITATILAASNDLKNAQSATIAIDPTANAHHFVGRSRGEAIHSDPMSATIALRIRTTALLVDLSAMTDLRALLVNLSMMVIMSVQHAALNATTVQRATSSEEIGRAEKTARVGEAVHHEISSVTTAMALVHSRKSEIRAIHAGKAAHNKPSSEIAPSRSGRMTTLRKSILRAITNVLTRHSTLGNRGIRGNRKTGRDRLRDDLSRIGERERSRSFRPNQRRKRNDMSLVYLMGGSLKGHVRPSAKMRNSGQM